MHPCFSASSSLFLLNKSSMAQVSLHPKNFISSCVLSFFTGSPHPTESPYGDLSGPGLKLSFLQEGLPCFCCMPWNAVNINLGTIMVFLGLGFPKLERKYKFNPQIQIRAGLNLQIPKSDFTQDTDHLCIC